jgi:2,4-dienoyl-CoA reductase-like NADH-dependent reductase (Old Yellow Enzyme family)
MNTLSTFSLDKLFEAVSLGTRLTKNRFVVAPMSRVSATKDGLVSNAMRRYYLRFAQGQFSTIITEGLYTDHIASQAYANQPGLVTPDQAHSWKHLVSQIKTHETLMIAQLMHAGALSQSTNLTLAPSSIKPRGKRMTAYGGYPGEFPMPSEMTPSDITAAISGFVRAASLACEAGFDGVEIHAANGYLLDQFLTDHLNHRRDSYGETSEHKFRIIMEIADGIRQSVPAEFIVGIRLSEGKVNQLDYRWEDGPAKAREILEQVKKARPDYIHIAAEKGNWEQDCVFPDGTSYTSLARQIVNVPVIANGGLHIVDRMKRVLGEGHADLLSIGKAAIADPSLPLKLKAGLTPVAFSPDSIRECANIRD